MQLLSGPDGPGCSAVISRAPIRCGACWSPAPPCSLYSGPDHYVSPSRYPSKHEHGEAVPTWNYATVHVKGHIRFIDDPGWLRTLVESLTDEHERQSVNRWRITDAPADYIAGMLRAIVGFEIQVSAIEGKFKGSQNRSAADRAGVAEALRAAGLPLDEVAQLAPESGS